MILSMNGLLIIIYAILSFTNGMTQLKYDSTYQIQLNNNDIQLYELVPEQYMHLTITRMIGVPLVSAYICDQISNRQHCLNEIGRLQLLPIVKYSDYISIDQCQKCFLIIKFTTYSQQCSFKLSTKWKQVIKLQYSNPMIYYGQNTFISTNKFQQIQINVIDGQLEVYTEPNNNQLISKIIKVNKYISLKLNNSNYQNQTIVITVKASNISTQNIIFTIELKPNNTIQLLDGFMRTTYLQQQQIQTLSYHHSHHLVFVTVSTQPTHYLPYLNIQVNNNNESINIGQLISNSSTTLTFAFNESVTFHSNLSNYLINILLTQSQLITLPFQYSYPAVTTISNPTHFIIECINMDNIQIVVSKCIQTDLQLLYTFQYQQQIKKWNKIKITNMKHIITIPKAGQTLFVKMITNNFIFYHIMVTKRISQYLKPYSFHYEIQDDQLMLEFERQNTKQYYQVFVSQNKQQIQHSTYCLEHYYYPLHNHRNISILKITPQLADNRLISRLKVKQQTYLGIRVQDELGKCIASKAIYIPSTKYLPLKIAALVSLILLWIILLICIKQKKHKKPKLKQN